MMKSVGNKYLVFSIIAITVLFDQITKHFAAGVNLPVINSIFHLTYVENTGAGFSILQNSKWLLIILTILVIGVMMYYYKELPDYKSSKYVVLSYSLVMAGAIGNLIDRIRFGYVIDFLDFQIWPVFNIADSAITIGVIGLIIYFWKH